MRSSPVIVAAAALLTLTLADEVGKRPKLPGDVPANPDLDTPFSLLGQSATHTKEFGSGDYHAALPISIETMPSSEWLKNLAKTGIAWCEERESAPLYGTIGVKPYCGPAANPFSPIYSRALGELKEQVALQPIERDATDLDKITFAYTKVADWLRATSASNEIPNAAANSSVYAAPLLYQLLKDLNLQSSDIRLATCVFFERVDHSWVAVRMSDTTGQNFRFDLDPGEYPQKVTFLSARGATEALF